MITLYMCREGCVYGVYDNPVYVQVGEDVYIECIDDNPVYVKGGGVCVYGVYR